MSVLTYCIFRPQRICPMARYHLAKRTCLPPGWKKDLIISELTYSDKPSVFTVHKRTFIKKRELIGTNQSFHLKSEHKKDKIAPEFEFVYCSNNALTYIWWTPMSFILIATILILSVKIIVDDAWTGEHLEDVPVDTLGLDDVNPLQIASILAPLALTALVVVLYMYRNVLLRLYYNKSTNEFIAVMLKYGVFRKKVLFKPSDVVNLEKIQMRGNFLIKGVPVSVSEGSFTDIRVYNVFTGQAASRPSQYDDGDIKKLLDRFEKKRTDDFLAKYKEKRKQRQGKDR